MANKKTAVDFFLKEMSDIIGIVNTDAFQNLLMIDAYNKAKQMEKEQIMEACGFGFNDGQAYMDGNPKFQSAEQYYNETYGK